MLNTFNTCALKPCSQCETICRIEVFRTAQKRPENIRIGCAVHGVYLKQSFRSTEDAVDAWNRLQNEINELV